MSLIAAIAEAVVAELNVGTFSQPFKAERHYRPVFDLAEMATLHVSVVARSVTVERFDRTRHQYDVQVDIGIQKKCQTCDLAELDGLMALVEEVADYLRDRRLAACPAAAWIKAENTPIYAPEHLEELRQFTSVLTLTYRVVR